MVFAKTQPNLKLSGERFSVVYNILGDSKEQIMDRAQEVCLEQTVELPLSLVPEGVLRDEVVGQIEDVDYSSAEGRATVKINYPVETTGTGLTQFLNVVFGNTSMQPGIQVVSLHLPDSMLATYPGPRFGTAGLREIMGVKERPLIGTALKPMGVPPEDLAEFVYQMALGGLDFIKDDHGLANQIFHPFEERVERCVEAVDRANRETGRKCMYVPNVTAPIDEIRDRALFAKQAGADGLEVSFGLTGMDAIRLLAQDDDLQLPVISHPALSGSFVTSPTNGISHRVLYGQLMRLAGADGVIFVSYGGRFAYSEEQCQGALQGCREPMGHLKPILPLPGGGMTLERLPELRSFYGRDVIFLVAGGLYSPSPDLLANAKLFAKMVVEADSAVMEQA